MRTGMAVIATAGIMLGTAAQASAAGWTNEELPPAPVGYNYLESVVSDGTTAWAFGAHHPSTPPVYESKAYQRGPGGWTEVPVPNVGRLTISAMSSPNDIWAGGQGTYSEFVGMVHWDGQRWSEVPTAETPPNMSYDYASMTSFAPDDVWMAGDRGRIDDDSSRTSGTVQHWDGKAWAHVPLPRVSETAWSLSAIGGAASNDLWALGDSGEEPGKGLALHWDGQRWSEIPVPAFANGPGATSFSDVLAVAPDDVWAIGSQGDQAVRQVAMHWDGTTWSAADIPDQRGSLADLTRVGDQLYAIGSAYVEQYVTEPYLLRHDGTSWRPMATPEAQSIRAGAALDDGSLLAVGYEDNSNGTTYPIAARYTG